MSLINPLPANDLYLYHYTTIDIALDYILKNGTIKFNTFSKVNDPRESKKWDLSPFVRAELNLELEDYEEISRKISDLLKANAKLVCFCCDKQEAIGKWQPEALLDRGFTKPSMWHHYGGKHNGVCLMFDRNKLNNAFIKQLNTKRLVSGEVDYSNQGILSSLNGHPFVINLINSVCTASYLTAIQNHLNQWFRELYLRKLTDWANEDEFRWIYFDDHSEPKFIGFGDSLEAIIVGEQVSEKHDNDILRYGAKLRADVARLTWHNGYPMISLPCQPYITHKHLLQD